jgi:hypothetical protein
LAGAESLGFKLWAQALARLPVGWFRAAAALEASGMTLPPPQLVQVTGIHVLLYALVPAWTLVRFPVARRGRSPVRRAGSRLGLRRVCGGGSASAPNRNRAGDGDLDRVLDRRGRVGAPEEARGGTVCGGTGSWRRLLLLAWAVRVLHPLQTWALGQSDAYSHLGFLRAVLEKRAGGNGD